MKFLFFLESGSQLNCFAHNGQIYPTASLCSFAIGVPEIDSDKLIIGISSNPFSTQTTLHSDNPLKNATLTVYNCFGQAVKQMHNLTGQTITLHRDELPSGLYFIRLIQDDKVIATDKLVITD